MYITLCINYTLTTCNKFVDELCAITWCNIEQLPSYSQLKPHWQSLGYYKFDTATNILIRLEPIEP